MRRLLAVGALAFVLALTACAGPALPSYNSVREDTRAAMQKVVDLLPANTEVEDRSTDTPYGCSGEGVMYTGHWVAHPGEDFDGQALIETLPDELGSDWVVDEDALTDGSSVNVESNGISMTVAAVDTDDGATIDILGISRCGSPPAL